MTITMNNTHNITIQEMEQFNSGLASTLTFQATNRKETYRWMEDILRSVRYRRLRKKDKGSVRTFLMNVTGYSRTQITELIARWKRTGYIRSKEHKRPTFSRTYTDRDIALLAEVDNEHGRLSGPATRKILRDEYEDYGNILYKRLCGISASHIYNLREHTVYATESTTYTKTQTVQRSIGERRKPEPEGVPGYLRVDSVHAGDAKHGEKGVYYINIVDEVVQWEVVLCVETIAERHLQPALQAALAQLPFVIHNVHADNGSEYINYQVAKMLEKLRVSLTKSRARQCNDNALVEGKNGSVVRKHLGHGHIPNTYAQQINAWCVRWLSPYLNFHRPCAFGKEVVVNKHGKRKKKYPSNMYMTPYQKLKSLKNAEQYLKDGVTFEMLDQKAYADSHTAFARKMNRAKQQLFSSINP